MTTPARHRPLEHAFRKAVPIVFTDGSIRGKFPSLRRVPGHSLKASLSDSTASKSRRADALFPAVDVRDDDDKSYGLMSVQQFSFQRPEAHKTNGSLPIHRVDEQLANGPKPPVSARISPLCNHRLKEWRFVQASLEPGGRTLNSDTAFTGSLPNVYDSNLGPLFFAPYAEDMGDRASALHALRVLELAAGTGIATAAMARQLPDAHIEATDLNAEMVLLAQSRRRLAAVRWSVANAMALPFKDGAFDLVTCQFGVMFFSDRLRAFRETRRVLEPGGASLFSVWDSIEHNDVARIVSAVAAASFPDDPPRSWSARRTVTAIRHRFGAIFGMLDSARSRMKSSHSEAAPRLLAMPPSECAKELRCATK